MSQYGDIAILAVELFPDLQDPRDAWQMATEAMGQDTQTQDQVALHTFLALCDAGKVLGIPASATGPLDGDPLLMALQDLPTNPQAADGLQSTAQEVLLGLWTVGLLGEGSPEQA